MGIHILVSRRKIQFLPSHGSSESKETQGNTEKYPVVNGGSGAELWVSIFDRQQLGATKSSHMTTFQKSKRM